MNAPVLTQRDLVDAIRAERAAGKTVAFANGCFDVLHVGHLRYLQDASRVGDVLVVAVNGDESVRKLKGEGRPVMPAHERAELVSAIRGVSFVTIFDEETPADLLQMLKPDFQCKGTDYTSESVPEAALVRSWGGRVVITGDAKEHSTSAILSKISR